jgi:carbamoyl-phosphate synthase small subunit
LQERPKAVLALEDGSVFEGRAFGATGRVEGEVVFNTAMTGYQEILTDPSYHGQLVVMTCPQIGNTGVNDEDPESSKPHVRGFIAREFARRHSSHRANSSLDEYMIRHGIVGLQGIDTRALTRILREKGCQKGILASGPAALDVEALRRQLSEVPDIQAIDTVRAVTSKRRYEWRGETNGSRDASDHAPSRSGPTIAVLDCGAKRNILRRLRDHGARVVVFPATAPSEEITSANPDGLMITNGPGDPETTRYAIETLQGLLGKLPMMGICLGHQLLALAAGAKTYKLKFGHHGANHPVLHIESGRIEITCQNHNYAVDEASAEALGFKVTHRSLFDGTVQGMVHPELGLFSVQYHPEACPGPHDSSYLWEMFLDHLGGKVR